MGLGRQEFNLQNLLSSVASFSNFPFLNANIFVKATTSPPMPRLHISALLPNVQPSIIVERQGQLIGIIGVSVKLPFLKRVMLSLR
jgi:2',3'-cyclic-nucleotide 2'-phosphodiesterase (5'-nucleotidase family)